MPAVLDRAFADPPAPPLAHPRLRHWAARIKSGATAVLELYQPATALGEVQTDIALHFKARDVPDSLEVCDWDDDLNAGLIALRVRAADSTNETARFALGLRAAMRKTTREFGDGFFNSVLLELVNESDLSRHAAIAEVVRHAHANAPYREGRSYDPCRDMIADAISGRMYELKNELGYPPTEARDILVSSLACYLDERFSVSSRKRLGLL